MDRPCKVSKSLNSHGYPTGVYDGELAMLHRKMCEEANGPCPPEHEASHTCNNRGCIEKEHLVWETRSQNNMRKDPEVRKAASQAGVKALQLKSKGWVFQPRRAKPYMVRVNKRYLGRFKTQAEAEAAYQGALSW